MTRFRLSSRPLQVVLALAAGVLILAILTWTRPEPEKWDAESIAIPVEVIRAEAETVRMTVTGNGTARAKTALKLVAKVPGEIVYMAPALREGNFVGRGEPLLRIDPRAYRLAVQRLEAQVRQGEIELERLRLEKANAEADLELARNEARLAEQDLKREQELVRRGTHSDAARDRAETAWINARRKAQTIENQLALWPGNYAAAEARLQQLRAQRGEAQLSLEHAEVAAPFNGRVLSRLVEVGQFVTTGTALAEIYDTGVMEIPLDIPLEDFQWLEFPPAENGAPVRGAKAGAEVRMRVGSQRQTWKGAVSRVEGQIDRATRTVGVFVEVREEGRLGAGAPLVPGAFLEIAIEGKVAENVIVLPRGAVDQNDIVYLVAEGKLQSRRVEVLRVSGSQAYITQGIEPGDLVVVSPIGAPVEGMVLRPILKDRPGEQPGPGAERREDLP